MNPAGIYDTEVERRLYFSKAIQIQTNLDPTEAVNYTDGLKDISGDKWIANWDQANLITSLSDNSAVDESAETQIHYPVLDIDFNCGLIPSSNPGKFHLYLDKGMTWVQYKKLLDVMAEVGILEPGYVQASKVKGFTGVRRPGVLKKNKHQSLTGANRYRLAQRALYTQFRQTYLLKEIRELLTKEQRDKLSIPARSLLAEAVYRVDKYKTNAAKVKMSPAITNVFVPPQEVTVDTF